MQGGIPEHRTISHMSIIQNNFNLFENYSVLTKLQRVTAYCCRFISNFKLSRERQNRVIGNLTILELERAMITLVKISQIQSFSKDYEDMKRTGLVSNSSLILSLNPFLDDKGIIRVSGRLKNANVAYEQTSNFIK